MSEAVKETHGKPIVDSTCMSCWEELIDENYVEYKSSEDSPWQPSSFCSLCINHLLATQWNAFTTRLATTNCKAEARRMIERGPPINIRDPTALPCPEDGEVHSLWIMATGEVQSAKLEGSYVGEERQKYWDEMRAFHIEDENDDDKEDGKTDKQTSDSSVSDKNPSSDVKDVE
mmetsp:Transcript_35398/g.36065  ORF Transcript_35398/g.36065 Transcript_35398/m.36065 type:complete len:174 (+) Transcript_35398:180-701(+)